MHRPTSYRKPLFLLVTAVLLCAQLLVGMPAAQAAPSVIATISVGGYPIDAGVNPSTNLIYVARTSADAVSVIDGATNTVTTTITVGDVPYGVDVNPSTNMIYVANKNDNTVSVINGATNAVTATVAVGAGPYDLDVNPATNRIYVVNQDGDSVSVINGATNAVTATVAVGDRPGGVCANPDTNLIYVANANSNNVSVISGATNTVTATIPVGDGPEGIDVNPATNMIYVANQWQYTVSVIDGYAGSVVDTVTLANMNNQGVGVNPATNRIYVSSFYNGRVNVIEGYSDTVIANLGVGSGPWGVGVNPATSRIYVGNSNSNSVSVIYDPFTITATAGSGGSISPSGAVGVNPGADQAFSITPNTGYHIDQVFVDGAYQGTPTGYTFSDVYADHTISAHFAVNTYTISTSVSGGGGSIQGTQTVDYDESASVAITPDAGYHVATITDNGVPQALANPYVIDNVRENHSVVATFAADVYDINASVFMSSGGTVDPAWQSTGYLGTASIDLIPDTGYHPSYILDNGAPATVADPYVISNVTGDHEVIVFFSPDPCTITASADGCGSVSGDGTYAYGDTVNMSATPDAGWHFVNWTEGGVEVSTDPDYSFTATGDRDLTAHFAINTYNVNASAGGGGGTVAPATQMVDWGDDATVNITPAANYHIASITDNGEVMPAANPYVISGVTGDHDVVVTFAPDTDTWYLAEGCTAGGMETWILVENPNPTPVALNISFAAAEGLFAPAALQGFVLAGETRVSFNAGDYMVSYDLSTIVSATGGEVVVERAMYGAGRTWATESIGTQVPASTWYLAEGSTGPGFETWVLVQNPGDAAVSVDLTLMTGSGEFSPVPAQDVLIPAKSRRSFNLGEYVSDYDVSTLVEASGDVVVERAMYGNGRAWGTCSIGTPAPATTWYLAEGSTGEGFETWVLVQNPGDTDVAVDLTFMTSVGEQAGPQDVTIPAGTRRTFNLGLYVTDYDVSALVASTGDVVVERSMYDAARTWGTCSIGAPAPASTWYLAEGSTGPGFETWVLVQNPGAAPVSVDLTFMTSVGEQAGPQDVTIPAQSRLSFNLGDYLIDYNVSTEVVSTGGGVVVERAMYGDGRIWATDSVGFAP